MDPIIKMMLQGYIDALDNMNKGDDSIRREVEDYKTELMAFGESQKDAATFFPNFQESGLLGKFMALSTKVALSAEAGKDTASGEGKKKNLVTPEKWLESYRTAYDQIKHLPVRERGLAVYRKLFEIGERHSDITEFLLEVEKENLLWKLCSEDALGIFGITLTGMDPLDKGLTYSVRKNIEAWDASVCEADAYYLQDLLSEDIAKTAPRLRQAERYVMSLGAHILIYRGPEGKEGIMEMIATGDCPRPAFMSKASNMVIAKLQARRTMDIIRKSLGLSFDDIMADEYLKYKLIPSSNLCGLSKAYVQTSPVLLDLMADAFRNEIVPDISLVDAIKREPSLKLGRWRMPEDGEVEKARGVVRNLFQNLPYFKYEDQLQGGSIHVGTGEGFEISLMPSQ